MKISKIAILFLSICLFTGQASAQYVQPERDDTIRMYPKAVFDTSSAKTALALGKATIKGVAFTRPTDQGFGIKTGKKIYANKITITLFPVTPYLTEYLALKKKENYKKLKFAYVTPAFFHYRLTAVTNSAGEFTFPQMKPGRYYLTGSLPWYQTGTYNKYTGSGYGSYGGRVDYYENRPYRNDYSEPLEKFVEIKSDGEVLEVRLK
ncbi:carboxypeptidase-like regulatory domain-containing protein [Niabella beijingensis]|uniref:carboxypeptidase-like regulatory domain-containing protein n=1 Tax=Niabella beijingensis TaxID=2872700 RepID=UPI001CBB8F26|nr:carboxypeptidase-like regulatory domain-containing protein [Niabella beijingensis]MBZ4187867.1 carboxypeptidase-like regulatory domain-containing protein [Niabella beijingensis]